MTERRCMVVGDLVGSLDFISDCEVAGWAINLATPSISPRIEVLLGSEVIGSGVADLPRPDVRAAGYPLEACGFRFIVANISQSLERISIRAVLYSEPIWSLDSLSYSIDMVSSTRVSGWATFRAEAGATPPLVSVLKDSQCLDSAPCNTVRDDVRNAGFAHTALCGFELRFPTGTVHVGDELSICFSAGSQENPVWQRNIRVDRAEIDGRVDRISRYSVAGWAAAPGSSRPVSLRVYSHGAVLGETVANIFRSDLTEIGAGHGCYAFNFAFGAPLAPGDAIVVEDINSRTRIGQSSEALSRVDVELDCKNFFATKQKRLIDRFTRRVESRDDRAGISVIMLVYNANEAWLAQAIDSVLAQWFQRWELVCVNDASTDPKTSTILRSYSSRDPRIVVIENAEKAGSPYSVNQALDIARYDLFCFIEQEDFILPNALIMVTTAFMEEDVDIVYSDEIITSENIDDLCELRARPAFSLDYYLSHPYFAHLLSFRKVIAQKLGGFDCSLKSSHEIDFALKAIGIAKSIAHIALPLYRCRKNLADHVNKQDDLTTTSALLPLQRFLRSTLPGTSVRQSTGSDNFVISWPDRPGKTLIVILTRDNIVLLNIAIESVIMTCDTREFSIVIVDHENTSGEFDAFIASLGKRLPDLEVMKFDGDFNYSQMNNLAVERFGGDFSYLLFLNDDVEATSQGWLQRLRSIAGREDVGAVGPMLLFEDGRVQHAGVVIGLNGSAEHVKKYTDIGPFGLMDPGYNSILTSCRDYSAITGACMMMRREVFEKVGGFDTLLSNAFNDTDLCLRIGKIGLKILYDGTTCLTHRESSTRMRLPAMMKHPDDTKLFTTRWKAFLDDGDPFYNQLLETNGEDHVPAKSISHVSSKARIRSAR